MPLVTVLPILQPFLLAFAAFFSKPQRRHFQDYLQALMCCDTRCTLAGMSRKVVAGTSSSAWDRFVTSDAWETSALLHEWQHQLRGELRRTKPAGLRLGGRQTSFLIVDDTHQPRTGKYLEGAGFHYDHTRGGSQWGHSLVVLAYRVGDYTFPYGGAAYVRQPDLEALNAQRARENLRRGPAEPRPLREFRSKVDQVVEALEAFTPLQPDRQGFLLMDSWYVNVRIVRAARRRGLDWISVLKRNRNLQLVLLSLETGEVCGRVPLTVGALLDQLLPAAALSATGVPHPAASDGQGWQSLRVGERAYRAVVYRAKLEGIGVVQVVLAQQRWHDGRWSPYVPLVTNRLDLTATEVITGYRQRWPVEVQIRDGKQELGLVDSQIERLEGTERHWLLSWVAQGMLTLLRLQADRGEVRTASGQPVASVGRTIGEVREFVKQCALVELLRWACAESRAGKSVEEIALGLGLPA